MAQREKWSFHREYKNDLKKNWSDTNHLAERNYKLYLKRLTQLERTVKTLLIKIGRLLNGLNLTKGTSSQQKILNEILQPLRYLMKHMAFKEEQECRIVYVTQMNNSLIQYDEKINRVYIDYEPSVMEYLEKIYIAPKAKDEKMVFEYLCSRGQEIRKGKEAVKVKISQNPFR